MRRLLVCALCAACHASYGIASDGASVLVQTSPFAMWVRDPQGRVVGIEPVAPTVQTPMTGQ